MDTLLSVKSLLARIGISKASLKRMWKTGRGPERIRLGRRVLGRRVLVSEAALQRWLARAVQA